MAKSFSIFAVLKGKNEAGPVLKGLGQVRTAGLAAKNAVGSIVGMGAKALEFIGLGGGLGGAIHGLKKFTDTESDAIKMSARLAGRMRMTLGEFEQWEFVAKRADMSTESFQGAMSTFALAGGQIESGIGRAATAVRKISPSLFRHLKEAKIPADRLRVALTALGDTKISYGIRALTASKLFGDQGEGMLRIAEMGRAEIEKQMDAAKRWGLNTEAAKDKQEAYETATKDLDAAMIGLRRTVGETLLPIVGKYTDMLAGWIGNNRELIGQKVGEWVEYGADMLGKFVDEAPAMIKAAQDIAEGLGPVAELLGAIGNGIGEISGYTERATARKIAIGTSGEQSRAIASMYKQRDEAAAAIRAQSWWSTPNAGLRATYDEARFDPDSIEGRFDVNKRIQAERDRNALLEGLTIEQIVGGRSSAPTSSRMPVSFGNGGDLGKAQIQVSVSDDRVRVKNIRESGRLSVSADVGGRSDIGDEGDE